jgi:hypothetical protein
MSHVIHAAQQNRQTVFATKARTESISKRASFNHALVPSNKNATWAQRAPSARLGLADIVRECAQTISALPAKSAMLSGDFETCDGSKNRRLRQCKISISEVLISVTLSLRGEVAERLKVAVC